MPGYCLQAEDGFYVDWLGFRCVVAWLSGRVADPGFLDGSGCFGRIRMFWLDPDVMDFCVAAWLLRRIADPSALMDLDVLIGSGRIRMFWSDSDPIF